MQREEDCLPCQESGEKDGEPDLVKHSSPLEKEQRKQTMKIEPRTKLLMNVLNKVTSGILEAFANEGSVVFKERPIGSFQG